jgi:predicted RNase H-like nuclease (RuvC/YqgF family)
MKAPELSELISESYPNFNNPQNNNNITKTEEYINELKNRIEELEQENALQIGQNINLKKEINILKDKIIKSEYENKSNITLLKTKINNLKEENEKYNKSLQEMNSINKKLCSDNKTLML